MRPYRGRHSEEPGATWSYSSSLQDRASYSGRSSAESGGAMGRQNPAGPRKRASSTSEQAARAAPEGKARAQRSRQASGAQLALKPEQ